MINIIHCDNGQNDSALFYIYKKLNVNPITVFFFFIFTFLAVSMTPSYRFLLVLTTLIFVFCIYFKKIKVLILKPLWSFKIFLIFSFAFSYVSSSDLQMSLLFLFKLILLLLISVLFNYFTDFKHLIRTIDAYLSRINLISVKVPVRKALFAFLLSIEFVKELFTEGKAIAAADNRTCGKSFLSKNSDVLKGLFHYSFRKAEEMESQYSLKSDFIEAKSTPVSLGIADLAVTGILMIEIILFLAVK